MSTGMTITVYRLDPATGQRTIVQPRTTVSEEHASPLPLSGWPPCRCPRSPACRKAEREATARY